MTICWANRDKLSRIHYVNIELNNLIYKSFFANSNIFKKDKNEIYLRFLINNSKINSLSYYKHNCVISSNGRSVSHYFKLNRLLCKYFANNGILIGIRKASF